MTALLLGGTAVIVWLAALRVAARWAGPGWPRIAAAAGLSGWLAAIVPLACGLLGLGTSPVALAGGALAVALPAGARAGRAAPAWSGGLGRPAAAAAGAGLAVLGYQVAFPRVRTDGFHLTEAVRWLHDGRPGALVVIDPELPVEHYPLANELILTWGIGVADGFAPVALWGCALLFLLAGSAYWTVRDRGNAALGAAAVAGLTVAVVNVEGSATGFASAAWTAAALSVLLRRSPLLGPGALLAGLAIGTKTNSALVLLPVLLWAALKGGRDRAALAGVAAGLLVAAPWPVRNLIMHGSPLWPFARPFGIGDPLPAVLREYQSSFLAEPVDAARAYAAEQLATLVRMSVAAAAGAVALPARHRMARGLAVLGLGCTLLWAAGPLSGPVDGGVSRSQLAYALPGLVAAILAAAMARNRAADALLAVLVAGCAASLGDGWPFRGWGAAVLWLAAGAGAGLLLRRVRIPLAPVAAVAVAALTLIGGPRFTDPPAGTDSYTPVLAWLAGQRDYRDGRSPVLSNLQDARFAGARLDHPVRPLPERPDCARLRSSDAWLVVFREERFGNPPVPATACLASVAPDHESEDVRVYRAPVDP